MKHVFELKKKNRVQIHRWHMLNTECSTIAENIEMQNFQKLWQSWHHNQFEINMEFQKCITDIKMFQ